MDYSHTRMRILSAGRRLSLVALVGIAISSAGPVSAAFDEGDTQPTITIGSVPGNGDNDDVRARELRAGIGHYFRDRLSLCGELSLYRPTGYRDGVSAKTIGLGLSFAVRWHFVRRPSFSFFTDWGVGFMVGSKSFPPGGTKYNATPNFGLGISTEFVLGWRILMGLRQLHMSNGKGLVANNPSFDGLGGFIGLAFRPGYKEPVPKVGADLPFASDGLLFLVDATYKNIDDENSPGGRVSMDFPLLNSANLKGQLAFYSAELADEMIWEGAVHVYRETPGGRLALGYSRMEFNVFTSDFFNFQIEHGLNDISTLDFIASFERKNLADDRVYGGLFITVYPMDALALRSGIAFERQEHEFFSSIDNLNDAGFNFGIQWSPNVLADVGVSLFLNSGIGYDVTTAGLRFQPGGKRSLRERHRQTSFIPIR
ncbi:MAG: acyloxyacyl hydrolase [candidate division Zixibacteria bacterium]|nr:acyloxyacyl hydrolase [candidate division Zixibacteria bacterium]MDH3936441.1 acyloxyacyl hydrolase [candidate division Zixibacteria bacterium]MDH4032620.1 acyloxyacyl hydrolase [candidate division Zixibacteria bacterium]